MKSETQDDWCTPPEVVSALLEFTGGTPVSLDPCTNPNSIVNADIEWYGPARNGTNGLVMPWADVATGLVYFNPPYTDKLNWMRKAHDEADLGVEIVGLLPADTDTQWFHRFGAKADMRCFWRGRMVFGGDRSYPARFPCTLFYWGSLAKPFKTIFGQYGWCA